MPKPRTESPKTYYLHVHQGRDQQWYVRARAQNGRTVIPTEGHGRRRDAARAARGLVGARLELARGELLIAQLRRELRGLKQKRR